MSGSAARGGGLGALLVGSACDLRAFSGLLLANDATGAAAPSGATSLTSGLDGKADAPKARDVG